MSERERVKFETLRQKLEYLEALESKLRGQWIITPNGNLKGGGDAAIFIYPDEKRDDIMVADFPAMGLLYLAPDIDATAAEMNEKLLHMFHPKASSAEEQPHEDSRG